MTRNQKKKKYFCNGCKTIFDDAVFVCQFCGRFFCYNCGKDGTYEDHLHKCKQFNEPTIS